MNHAIIRLQEELRILGDVRTGLVLGACSDPDLHTADPVVIVAQLDREITETRQAITCLRRAWKRPVHDPLILKPTPEEKRLAQVYA